MGRREERDEKWSDHHRQNGHHFKPSPQTMEVWKGNPASPTGNGTGCHEPRQTFLVGIDPGHG